MNDEQFIKDVVIELVANKLEKLACIRRININIDPCSHEYDDRLVQNNFDKYMYREKEQILGKREDDIMSDNTMDTEEFKHDQRIDDNTNVNIKNNIKDNIEHNKDHFTKRSLPRFIFRSEQISEIINLSITLDLVTECRIFR